MSHFQSFANFLSRLGILSWTAHRKTAAPAAVRSNRLQIVGQTHSRAQPQCWTHIVNLSMLLRANVVLNTQPLCSPRKSAANLGTLCALGRAAGPTRSLYDNTWFTRVQTRDFIPTIPGSCAAIRGTALQPVGQADHGARDSGWSCTHSWRF
jgi:hypothetical protein